MASRPVPAQYLNAGQDYLEALLSLGLTPAFLGWGWDTHASTWALVLVTSVVEAGGPLALNKLLFKAYNAGATPKEISPFIVRVFSPEVVLSLPSRLSSQFWILGEKNATIQPVPGKSDPRARPTKIENIQMTFMGLDLEMVNSYQTKPGAADRALAGFHRRRQDWQRFKKNVERLAA
jgi:hypothetical protein